MRSSRQRRVRRRWRRLARARSPRMPSPRTRSRPRRRRRRSERRGNRGRAWMTHSMAYELRHDGFLFSDDPSLIDLDAVHGFLSTCYWSPGIPRQTLERAIGGSVVAGIYETSGPRPRQAGFARVVTDKATFAYLCDVFVLEPYRGRGLSKRLIEFV